MAAHQPLLFPYLGYFDRMERCDVFVVRDDTQFAKRNFMHRNRIRVPQKGAEPKLKWLTVPVDKDPIPISDVAINHHVRSKNRSWQKDMELQIRGCYAQAPHFNQYFPRIVELLNQPHQKLVGLTMALIHQFCEWFEVSTEVILATQMPDFAQTGDPTDDLVLLTQLAGCTEYMSGDGAKIYIKEEPFQRAGKTLSFQQYQHPVYEQQALEFVPYVACLDALFHVGGYPRSSQ